MATNDKLRVTDKPVRMPISEYAKTIYESWDSRGETPPKGFTTWMEYWEVRYGQD